MKLKTNVNMIIVLYRYLFFDLALLYGDSLLHSMIRIK
jgi:hypothetical protein